VLDQLEERSLLLKQHLREAEIELSRKRTRADALEEEQRRLREEASRLDARLASLDEDVALALSGEKEELARYAVRQLLPVREAGAAVRERIAEVAAERDRIAERLEAQERDFEDLKQRVQLRLDDEARSRRVREASLPGPGRAVSDEEVELELLRRERSAGAELS
jgi:phage shock protein A